MNDHALRERPGWLSRDGEMAELISSTEWGLNGLGRLESWSPALRATLGFVLDHPFPMLLWWGPDAIQLYNDALRQILGTQHPKSLGQPLSEWWSGAWRTLRPMVEGCFAGGPALWIEDLELTLRRSHLSEERHFTIALNAVSDDRAPRGIGGVLATLHETTGRVIEARRMALLHDVGARIAHAKRARDACAEAAAILAMHPKDVPYALLYLLDGTGRRAFLAAAAGIAVGEPASPRVDAFADEPRREAGWHPLVREALSTGRPVVADGVATRFEAAAGCASALDLRGPAVVLAMRPSGEGRAAGVLIAGASPLQALDDAYRIFFERLAVQIGTAIAGALTAAEEPDAAALKRAEAALRESEAQLAGILAQLPVGVALFDHEGRLRRSNTMARRCYAIEAMPSQKRGDATHWRSYSSDGAVLQPFQYPVARALRGETVAPGSEVLNVSPRGEQRWLRVSAAPFRDRDDKITGVIAVLQDISQEKEAEATLLYLNETLEQRVAARAAEAAQANKRLRAEIAERVQSEARLQELQSELFHASRLSAMGQMAAALAHELSQPLGAAANYANAARRWLASADAGGREGAAVNVEMATAAVLRSAQIIRRLRDFVREGETEKRVESVISMVEDASTLALAGPEALGITVEFRFDPEAPTVFADRIQIQQVILNLLRNAVEAVSQCRRRRIVVSTTQRDDASVEIAVADSGPGLSAGVAARLFEPFVSTKRNGMGLGLSICRTIVETHGGMLQYESNPSGGAVFRFTLAVAPATEAE